MDLISKVLGSEKLLNNEHQETFRLLGKVLSFRKFVDSSYPKTLKLLGDAIVSNQISKNRNNETLKFLSKVYIDNKPSDDEAFRQLAEMLVKKERLENNVSKPQASTINTIQEPLLPLSDEALDESNENQVSHNKNSLNETTPNDGSPGEQDSATVDQNASMEITESAEPKKRNKRSSKSDVKSNSDSFQSKDKSKESREKSSKNNKRSRRSTKDITKPKSKNKHKRSKRQKSKGKTEISGHDGESNLNDLDTDMMGDDPNAYNENSHSEAPLTKTVDVKPTVVDSKTNEKSSTSYKTIVTL
ncbi:hypothetical protein NBO_431g0001 [Nosema bombycis CQ1]|uniref:Uncharacterized protein n=1 Tax=Nosema bombycis (strain CQ1 / CVCC 102059) TaxID=578461 RepID=R0KP56_NOSB1|nr:hypothetical protein NBO_431g0001 [Nosema bombycis CQ1]|eukprot:EOB12476.1 hypothetical protein NBO_431g0001 [Nosema bombycis CQ1]